MAQAGRPGAPDALALALSPLLPPLRFLARAGVGRLSSLRQLEPLVALAVDAAGRAVPTARAGLTQLSAAAQGFDEADEAGRRKKLLSLLPALAGLLPLPAELVELQQRLTAPPAAPPDPSAPPAPAATAPKTRAPRPRSAPAQGELLPRPAVAPEVRAGESPAPASPESHYDGPLAAPIEQLRGIGPASAQKLRDRGIATVGDLLWTLPRAYEDRREVKTVAQARVGERAVIAAEVVSAREARWRRGRRLEVSLRDAEGGQLQAVWFHFRSQLAVRFTAGARVLLSGEVKPLLRGGRGKVMHHPDLEWLTGVDAGAPAMPGPQGDDSFGRVIPVYTEVEGIPPRTYRRILQRAADEVLPQVEDPLPPELLARRGLMPLPRALREVHFPEEEADEVSRKGTAAQARRRLVFEELFLVQLGLALRRQGMRVEPGIAFRATPASVASIVQQMPWPLTGAQRRAVLAIAADMRRPEPMNRLLQGDVGSGKTAVALCAALLAAEDGYQTALMAPTEILAEQHTRSLRGMLQGRGIHVELVTGGLGTRERTQAEQRIRSGAVQIVVGTHALAEEGTAFARLGLAIVDEQHRFGVLTRARLMAKGPRPDVLVMTATPIPRTLALTLYGDLDSSVLDELPPGRTPVATKVFRDAARDRAYAVVRRELAKGHQAYVVLPLVEESDKLVDVKAATAERERLAAEVFADVPIGLLHGRQSPAERQEAMERFRRGEDRILVATTVIEVGVDVPNASVMLIEHAERFGLSQLHQLRGRVGRGAAQSHCLLVTGSSGAEWGETARARLKVMEETTDGFLIAEEDLRLRGPGEFLGTRQSGLPDFAVAELARDQVVLAEAREEAFAWVAKDPELRSPARARVRELMLRRFRGKLSLARVG